MDLLRARYVTLQHIPHLSFYSPLIPGHPGSPQNPLPWGDWGKWWGRLTPAAKVPGCSQVGLGKGRPGQLRVPEMVAGIGYSEQLSIAWVWLQ